MRRIMEIHAAEGGADSQLLVQDLAAIYTKLVLRLG